MFTFNSTFKYCGSGYMSPEYAMYGHFSMKSDVYSFGVLILEIISGKKNSSLYEMDGSAGNLVTYVSLQLNIFETFAALFNSDQNFNY